MRLSNCLKRFILWYKAYRMRRCYGKRISKIMHLNNISSKAIEGENEFIRKWQTLSSNVNINYYRCYANYIGKDINILPEDICCNIIEPILDPIKYRYFYDDKNMFERILTPDFLPIALLRNIRGFYYSKNYEPVHIETDKELYAYLVGYDKIIIKPTVDTESGRNVVLFIRNTKGGFENKDGMYLSLDFLKTYYKKDFIVQECLKQHPVMAHFNSSSVNTLRVCTYRSVKTDKIIVTNIALRVGKNGNDVDNIHAGGIVFGVGIDGKINAYGTNHWGEKFQCFNDIDYRKNELYIPEMSSIIKFAKQVASLIIHHRLLALDIMLTENGCPKLLEYNIGGFSTWLFQFNTGTVFGEYTDEVIDYCSQHLNDIDLF